METPIQDLAPLIPASVQPRAQGAVRLTSKLRDTRTVIDRLHQQGSLKILFPSTDQPDLTAVLLNTAGGITGGDRFDTRISAQPGTHITVTTQAAERAYRAVTGAGRVCTGLTVCPDARLCWLPQETLLYDGAKLRRRLDVTLHDGARCLLIESIVFGRAAMGEAVRDLQLDDHITLTKDGRPLFADRTHLSGDAVAHMSRTATGQAAGAMASVVFYAPDAPDLLDAAREVLPETGGISSPASDLLFARILAPDGYALRQSVLPLLSIFRDTPLPRPWMI